MAALPRAHYVGKLIGKKINTSDIATGCAVSSTKVAAAGMPSDQ